MMQCHEDYPPPGLEAERKRRRTPIKKINGAMEPPYS